MTRTQQISAAVEAHKGNMALRTNDDPFSLGFKMGAIWADLNPQILLYRKKDKNGKVVFGFQQEGGVA